MVGAKVVGAAVGAKVVGAAVGAKVVGAAVGAKVVGAAVGGEVAWQIHSENFSSGPISMYSKNLSPFIFLLFIYYLINIF
jgi:hypothetical protein